MVDRECAVARVVAGEVSPNSEVSSAAHTNSIPDEMVVVDEAEDGVS